MSNEKQRLEAEQHFEQMLKIADKLSKRSDAAASIAEKWKQVQAGIQDFAERVVLRPEYSFEWADVAVKLSVERAILDEMMVAIDLGKVSLLHILKYEREQLIKRMLDNSDAPTSSSPCRNAVCLITAAVRSSYVSPFGHLASWIRNEEPEPEPAPKKKTVRQSPK